MVTLTLLFVGDLAVGVMVNQIFAVGGETRPSSDLTCSDSVPVPTVERLNPTQNEW